ALSFAHKNRVVHGNLRPSNVLFTSDGVVKLADFGLEEHYGTDNYETNWYLDGADTVAEVSDVFSIGVILYEMITGSIPLWRDGKLVVHDKLGKVPQKVQKVLFKLIEKKPEKRYQTVDAVMSAMEDLFKGRKKRKRKRKKVGGPWTVLITLVGLGTVYLYFTGQLPIFISVLRDYWTGVIRSLPFQ
ncbi:MAG: protein kinase, partial [Nitrospinota bacterium]